MATSLLRQPTQRTLRILRNASQTYACIKLRSTSQHAVNKKLFTPGPLAISMTTKQAMLRDVGSRDAEFVDIVAEIRSSLLRLAGVSEEEYTCVPMQGAGTFSIEAVLSTVVPRHGKVLILENGAYGRRQVKICERLGIPCDVISFPEDTRVCPDRVRSALCPDHCLVSMVHCETSTGIVNPLQEVGDVIREATPGAAYFVDAMSSFGGIPINVGQTGVNYLVTSANKCLQGSPGSGFVICSRDLLLACKGNARSYSLDLVDQLECLEQDGQFRFTPPTHSMLALYQALQELEAEGGVSARAKRYELNSSLVSDGMRRLGFRQFLPAHLAGYIITSYRYPTHPKFNFSSFYQRLSDKGFVIYPGKVQDADCFRIGHIGDLHPSDVTSLLEAVEDVCDDMKIPLPLL